MVDHDADEQVPVDDLTPEEASRIIHSHRKVRYGTACWPCRQRKVKCDNQQPCENCVKREHPQLCSYKPNRSSASKNNAAAAHTRKRARSPSDADDTVKDERQESWPPAIGLSTNQDDSDSVPDRYVGQNSIPALLGEQSPNNKEDGTDIRRDMRSILGLDTSAPFPLMSSNHLQRLARDIANELPSDREVMKLFRTYKEIPQPFWGFVLDIDELESNLMIYLEDRSRNASKSGKASKPVTASWLAILFAVLAVGSQYHESPYHIRTKDSQKYIQISFHLLRLANFLLRPSFDSIQALLLTNFVLLNDMKAEASWALTGLTCRLAQSLGLHRPMIRGSRDSSPPAANSKEMIRRRLWWTCVWHDTLTSLSFDRSSMTNIPSCPIPHNSDASVGNYTYLEMMYNLIEIISRRLNPDVMASASYQQIYENCEAVEELRKRAAPHMQDKEKCKTALDRLQFFAIRLHTSFVISVACRPALRRDCPFDPAQKKALSERCRVNLTETVTMFLAMHQLSVIPTRSWAFTYHGLSSALLLGLLSDTKSDPEVRQLQGDLIEALSATAAKEVSSPEAHVAKTDKDIELSGPLWRALTALKNIYDHGQVNMSSLKRDGELSAAASGNRTPLQLGLNGQGGYNNMISNPSFRPVAPVTDAREDAAMAMAEMQNGASIHDMSASLYRMTYPQQMNNNIAMDGIPPIVDPMQFNAPMELYDSIWVESPPDPWNTGVDAFNFDFLAQPPPGQNHQQFYF
ncbi:Zn2Cys6 transcriptional regulator [Trichoderma parareesei]|uniref:Zn2Cys6 transcriptional regulator n=1 Tax=Trichoderma parareesei TaxID=858221 RepID=A0A2H3A1T3_TRIPA|nr:Zn2Cys6 transcriptional regulator [Trichoderma parareesei]